MGMRELNENTLITFIAERRGPVFGTLTVVLPARITGLSCRVMLVEMPASKTATLLKLEA